MHTALNDILEVTVKLLFDGIGAIRNVYHVRVSTATTLSDLDVVEDMATYMGLMYTEIESIMPNNLTVEGLHMENLTQDYVMGDWPTLGGFVGGISSTASIALGVAAVVRMLTVARGVQGRKFLGALITSATDDSGILTPASLLKIAAFAAPLLQPVEIGDGYLAFSVYDRLHKTVEAVTEVICNAIPGYQRRRKQNVGI